MSQQTDCSSVTFSLDDLVVNSDDLLPPLVKLEKYSSSDAVLHRQIAARDIVETLCSAFANDTELDGIFRIFHALAEDYEPSVRMELMERVPHMALLCRENSEKADHFIFQHLLPVTMKYLTDISNQVRKTGHSSLLYIMERSLIGRAALEEKILPLVLQLTESSHIDDYRTEAISLVSKISSLVGKEVTEQVLVAPFISLCDDSSFHVRKICAESFGEICTVVGCETTELTLLPKFSLLCEDTVWGVRKACAEVFTPVSCMCSMESRHRKLAPIYLNLLCDESRWVRMAAFQSLGLFISTFAKPGKTGMYCDKDGLLKILDVPNGIYPVSKINLSCEQFIKSMCEKDIQNEKIVQESNECSEEPCDVTTKSESHCCNEDYSTDSEAVIETDDQKITCGTTVNDNFACSDVSYCEEREDISSNLVNNLGILINKCQGEQNCPSENSVYKRSEEEFVNIKLGEHSEDIYSGQPCDNHLQSVLNNPQQTKTVIESNGDTCENFRPDTDVSEIVNGECVPYVNESCIIDQFCDNNVCANLSLAQCDTCNPALSGDHCGDEKMSEKKEKSAFCCNEIADESSELCAFNSFQYWKLPFSEIETEVEERLLKHLCDEPTWQNNSFCCKSVIDGYSGQNHINSESITVDQKIENTEASKVMGQENGCVQSITEESKKICSENILNLLRKCDFIDLISIQSSPLKQVLSPLDQDIVPPELLLLYLSMTNFTKPPRVDAEMARHCAYSLPAVALTLGRRFWPCLKETYNTLASDMQGFIMQWKVRRTLASSMHKLAVILGPDIVARDLLPVFSGFIRDLDEVRIGVLQHLSEFLAVLRPKERKEYLPRLSEFLNTDNERNWRFRHCLAEQLIPIAQLYDAIEVRQHLIPLSLSLLQDKVAEVRKAAVQVIAVMVRRMNHGETSLTKDFLTELEQFLNSRKWLHRQMYVYLCQEFIKADSLPSEMFAELIMPQLLYLCWDQVANVRLAVARCLALFIWPLAEYSDHSSPHRELLLQAIHALQEDVDSDVKYFANIVATDDCSCLQHGHSKVMIDEISIAEHLE